MGFYLFQDQGQKSNLYLPSQGHRKSQQRQDVGPKVCLLGLHHPDREMLFKQLFKSFQELASQDI